MSSSSSLLTVQTAGLLLLLLAAAARGAEVARAVAYVAAQDPSRHPDVGGHVVFSQAYAAGGGLSGVTVDKEGFVTAQFAGLPPEKWSTHWVRFDPF